MSKYTTFWQELGFQMDWYIQRFWHCPIRNRHSYKLGLVCIYCGKEK